MFCIGLYSFLSQIVDFISATQSSSIDSSMSDLNIAKQADKSISLNVYIPPSDNPSPSPPPSKSSFIPKPEVISSSTRKRKAPSLLQNFEKTKSFKTDDVNLFAGLDDSEKNDNAFDEESDSVEHFQA